MSYFVVRKKKVNAYWCYSFLKCAVSIFPTCAVGVFSSFQSVRCPALPGKAPHVLASCGGGVRGPGGVPGRPGALPRVCPKSPGQLRISSGSPEAALEALPLLSPSEWRPHPPLHPWLGWGPCREAGNLLRSPSSGSPRRAPASSAVRSSPGMGRSGAPWDRGRGQAGLAHPALLLPPQPHQNHVSGDHDRPHGGPGGDPGIQLQQGQQASRPHHAVPHRCRGGPHGGGDAGESPSLAHRRRLSGPRASRGTPLRGSRSVYHSADPWAPSPPPPPSPNPPPLTFLLTFHCLPEPEPYFLLWLEHFTCCSFSFPAQ